MTVPVDLLEIAPGLHRLRVSGGPAHLLNSYIWVGPDEVTLFDTGWPGSAVVIDSALRRLGRTRADVGHVVLSHSHNDHAGAAAEVATWPNTVIVASALDAAVIRGAEDGDRPRLTAAERELVGDPVEAARGGPCRVDVEVSDGATLIAAGEARIIGTPGHTPGSIALHVPSLDTVLTGDTVAELHGAVIVGVFNIDRELTRRSVLAVAATGARTAGFGHGEAVLHEAAARIRMAEDPFADAQ